MENLVRDKSLESLLIKEKDRQSRVLSLIASENYASLDVLHFQGSLLTNKYAEGDAGKRYYGGCSVVDEIEFLAIERVKKLFSCNYANVQPHSGSQANAAVFLTLLKPGEKIFGLDLSHGGHLTHGAKVSFSGQIYESIAYQLNRETGEIDYDKIEDLARRERPRLIIAGYSGYPRTIDWDKFRNIADSIGAYLLADIAHIAGPIAAGLFPSPLYQADIISSTTHKTLRGPRGGLLLGNLPESEMRRFNKSVCPGIQGGPMIHTIAAKAQSFYEALQPKFVSYQNSILENAKIFAKIFLENGFRLVANGTDTHMILVDLRNHNINGADAEKILEDCNVIVNKNMVPGDPLPPQLSSGIRIGTPAITTRGIGLSESKELAKRICDLLQNPLQTTKRRALQNLVSDLVKTFPLPY